MNKKKSEIDQLIEFLKYEKIHIHSPKNKAFLVAKQLIYLTILFCLITLVFVNKSNIENYYHVNQENLKIFMHPDIEDL